MNFPPGPRWLYLHGFASGPESTKGVRLAAHYARQGIHLERLDLRRPSLERLSFAAMTRTVRDALGGERDRAILFGSSMGGLTACHVAEVDARVCALVLLAPALRISRQLRRTVGEPGVRRWRETGWWDIQDYAERRPARVHAGLLEELDALETSGADVPDVRVPTLIVHGRQDTTTEVGYSREWARDRRHVRLVEVEDGHELVESLERIAAEADDFLRPFLAHPAAQ